MGLLGASGGAIAKKWAHSSSPHGEYGEECVGERFGEDGRMEKSTKMKQFAVKSRSDRVYSTKRRLKAIRHGSATGQIIQTVSSDRVVFPKNCRDITIS